MSSSKRYDADVLISTPQLTKPQVVSLETGQGLLFAPGGVGLREFRKNGENDMIAPLGAGYLIVQSRLRITRDGGHSLLAVADAEFSTRQSPSTAPLDVPVPSVYAPLTTSLPKPILTPRLSPSNTPTYMSPLPVQRSKPGPSTPSTQAKLVAVPPVVPPKPPVPAKKVVTVPAKFAPLIKLLANGGLERNWLGIKLGSMKPLPYKGKLQQYLDKALNLGIIHIPRPKFIELTIGNIYNYSS